MHLLYRLIFLFILFACFSVDSTAKKITAEQLLFNSAQGREFYIAYPPNDIPNVTLKRRGCTQVGSPFLIL